LSETPVRVPDLAMCYPFTFVPKKQCACASRQFVRHLAKKNETPERILLRHGAVAFCARAFSRILCVCGAKFW
jgi:hypothetical protein